MAHPFARRPKNGFAASSPSLAALALLLLAGSPGALRAQSISTDSPAAGTPTVMAPKVKDLEPRPFRANPNATPPPPEVAAALTKFFKGLVGSEVRKSFTDLLVGTRLSARDENVQTLIDKTQQGLSLYGKAHDFEVYYTRFIGTRLLVTTYILALDVQPIRWRFIYYKADTTWTLINLRVDDSMEDLLE